jgi:hypothetical protein
MLPNVKMKKTNPKFYPTFKPEADVFTCVQETRQMSSVNGYHLGVLQSASNIDLFYVHMDVSIVKSLCA